DGGGARAAVPSTPRETAATRPAPAQQRTSYDRGLSSPPLEPPPPPPQSPAPSSSHGATRFSSVFGTRRR
ncbi:MAG: xanthine dehydrogenase family protein molybdopterin-binding subunit, partial [Bradyrhizobium sp.]|nr:xanthine dehydrogenase family protein molybdopterin-binding subunit [Bradyrhizobium sp.]